LNSGNSGRLHALAATAITTSTNRIIARRYRIRRTDTQPCAAPEPLRIASHRARSGIDHPTATRRTTAVSCTRCVAAELHEVAVVADRVVAELVVTALHEVR
jgi:hypothetical protein